MATTDMTEFINVPSSWNYQQTSIGHPSQSVHTKVTTHDKTYKSSRPNNAIFKSFKKVTMIS